jgi:hypothetical protein
MKTKFNIEQFLSLEDYATDERQSRRSGSSGTQEFYTPYSIVKRMCDKISEADWSNPEKTFLEPSFGNGQFVIFIIYNRIQHGVTWKDALSTLYGVELMSDNVQETKDRIISLLTEMEISFDKKEAMKIMDHNLVCSDFFKWDFENWCPIKEQEDPQSFSLF